MKLAFLFEDKLFENILLEYRSTKETGKWVKDTITKNDLVISKKVKIKEPKTGIERLVDKWIPIYDIDYPSKKIRQEFIDKVIVHSESLFKELVDFIRSFDFIDKNSVILSSSKSKYNQTNELSLSKHINFKLKNFNTHCSIRISDHDFRNEQKVNPKTTYFMHVTAILTDKVKYDLKEHFKKIYNSEYEKVYGKKEAEVVNQKITPRDETKVNRKILSLKPSSYSKPEAYNYNPNSIHSKEAYKELLAPTKIGLKNNFYYDDSKPFNQQNFPSKEVKISYVEKLNNLINAFFNDVAGLLQRSEIIDKQSIKINDSTSTVNGYKSHSKYLNFKFVNAKFGCALRSSDHNSYNFKDNKFIYSAAQTTWASDAFKENFSKFLKSAKTDNYEQFIISMKNYGLIR